MVDAGQSVLVWQALTRGKSLRGLKLPTIDGRIDLRGLVAPEPAVARQYEFGPAKVNELAGLIEIRKATWKGLDFRGARLPSLRFHGAKIVNCCFDDAYCEDWRMWGTSLRNCSFKNTDLRRSALGGIGLDGRSRNSFVTVDFTCADLRQTAYKSATFVDCTFVDSNLRKVEFQGSVFRDCVFAGDLDGVMFYRHAFRGERFPPNEMKGVDLRGARLKWVEFRGLNMDRVLWPDDDEHIIVEDYVATVDRVVTALKPRSDLMARQLVAVFENRRKWAGPKQKRGVISKYDLREIGGNEAVEEFLRLCRPN